MIIKMVIRLMKFHYDKISHLDRKFKFGITRVGDKSSRSYKVSKELRVMRTEIKLRLFFKRTYKGKKFRENLYMYNDCIRVFERTKRSENLPSNRKNISFGVTM